MSAGFTPGPWFAEHRKTPNRDGYYTDVFTADNGTGSGTVCSVSWYPKPKDETGSIGTFREANAALIAAAPDLYELALKAPCECDYDHSCRRCRALAKARGESVSA